MKKKMYLLKVCKLKPKTSILKSKLKTTPTSRALTLTSNCLKHKNSKKMTQNPTNKGKRVTQMLVTNADAANSNLYQNHPKAQHERQAKRRL